MSIKDAAGKEIKIELGKDTTKKTPSKGAVSGGDIFKYLKKKALKKPITEYQTHPLNLDNTPSTGRILRGLEGMFTSLDLAFLDVVFGLGQKLGDMGGKKE